MNVYFMHGHLVRRLHQMSTKTFAQFVQAAGPKRMVMPNGVLPSACCTAIQPDRPGA